MSRRESVEKAMNWFEKAYPDSKPDVGLDEVHLLLRQAESRMENQEMDKLNLHSGTVPKPFKSKPTSSLDMYVQFDGTVAAIDPSKLISAETRKSASIPRKIEEPVAVRKQTKKKEKMTAGPLWFDMPRTDLTPELKRDLQLIQMREVLDPKRHYKKNNGKLKATEFLQTGTIIAGPADFFSGRIPKKERRGTFADEILANDTQTDRFKRKYNEIQAGKQQGKNRRYKGSKLKRRRK